jgi:hypothetical protein
MDGYEVELLDLCISHAPVPDSPLLSQVRDRLIGLVEQAVAASRGQKDLGSGPRLVDLGGICGILASIGDEVVVQRIRGWRRVPALADDFSNESLRSAGWEMTDDGRRRSLHSVLTIPLLPRVAGDGAASGAVRVLTPLGGKCPSCGRDMLALLDVDLRQLDVLPEELSFLNAGGTRMAIPFCEECGRYPDDARAFAVVTDQGAPPAAVPPADASPIPRDRFVVAAPPEPFWRNADAPNTRIGGPPTWQQYAAYPSCPKCEQTMYFVGQVDCAEMSWGDEVIYAFVCHDCRLSTSFAQQT